MIIKILLFNIILFSASNVFALDTATAIYCILGEARNQGLIGLTAVAEALRNRNTTQGVYGCQAVFTEPQWVWDLGRKAWEASATSNLVKGAQFWESTDFKLPYWAKTMKQTAKIRKHRFFK